MLCHSSLRGTPRRRTVREFDFLPSAQDADMPAKSSTSTERAGEGLAGEKVSLVPPSLPRLGMDPIGREITVISSTTGVFRGQRSRGKKSRIRERSFFCDGDLRKGGGGGGGGKAGWEARETPDLKRSDDDGVDRLALLFWLSIRFSHRGEGDSLEHRSMERVVATIFISSFDLSLFFFFSHTHFLSLFCSSRSS